MSLMTGALAIISGAAAAAALLTSALLTPGALALAVFGISLPTCTIALLRLARHRLTPEDAYQQGLREGAPTQPDHPR
ncbi:hypothetical protein ACIBKY_51275 [Nonomuraea sp. NPDC050394]|uniref:hypothetical protein n=1 Tax=Nonomuraea sp. NPDC050394 TaxID=3364363 RepID=UPI003790CB14